jgi:hypothetical protein
LDYKYELKLKDEKESESLLLKAKEIANRQSIQKAIWEHEIMERKKWYNRVKYFFAETIPEVLENLGAWFFERGDILLFILRFICEWAVVVLVVLYIYKKCS